MQHLVFEGVLKTQDKDKYMHIQTCSSSPTPRPHPPHQLPIEYYINLGGGKAGSVACSRAVNLTLIGIL